MAVVVAFLKTSELKSSNRGGSIKDFPHTANWQLECERALDAGRMKVT